MKLILIFWAILATCCTLGASRNLPQRAAAAVPAAPKKPSPIAPAAPKKPTSVASAAPKKPTSAVAPPSAPASKKPEPTNSSSSIKPNVSASDTKKSSSPPPSKSTTPSAAPTDPVACPKQPLDCTDKTCDATATGSACQAPKVKGCPCNLVFNGEPAVADPDDPQFPSQQVLSSVAAKIFTKLWSANPSSVPGLKAPAAAAATTAGAARP